MAAPKYLNEVLYTFVHPPRVPVDSYEVDVPESRFERHIQGQLAQANGHLRNEEFRLALTAFQRLRAEILRIADPQLPVVESAHPGFVLPAVSAMVEPMVGLAVQMLANTTVPATAIPGSLVPGTTVFSPAVTETITGLGGAGLQAATPAAATREIQRAVAAAQGADWEAAETHFEAAISVLGNRQAEVRAILTHDLAIAQEKNGNRAAAVASVDQATKLFKRSGNDNGQLQALLTAAGLNERNGDADVAARLRTSAGELRINAGLEPVFIPTTVATGTGGSALTTTTLNARVTRTVTPSAGRLGGGLIDLTRRGGVLEEVATAGGTRTTTEPAPTTDAFEPSETLVLMSATMPAATVEAKSIGILGRNGKVNQVQLNQAGLTRFYESLVTTTDIGLLMDFIWQPAKFVAYLPHIYFFILPMAIGDCLAGLGAHEPALDSYREALDYPFMNNDVEAVRLWTRLADTYLAWGDTVYRRAGDDTEAQAAAASIYANIVRPDGTIPADSPLYQPARFSPLTERARAVAAGLDDPAALTENPQIVTPIAEAHTRLQQIAEGLNYLGIAGDYRPPFTFEYLQSLARTLADQAERAEQGYIHFKSQAENEQLRAEQLDQQVEVAAASVELERRGVAEAHAGVQVANESLDYARVKRQNAREARDAFDDVRWDLLELTQLEAWAGASSVDRDDQVKLTITGFSTYEADSKRRNVVMQDLARKRTRITHDLEAARLDREVENAEAYEDVAEAQRVQAAARERVARMRQQIAEIQHRHARENAEFLDLREFSSRTWYEMARVSRRLIRRYLDMAIEVAYLMELAYTLETGRDLARIRLDYAGPGTQSLLAASRLRADIESFSHDLVTSTTSKKAPIKTTFSLAEQFSTAFAELVATGRTSFDTALHHVERSYPGAYLGRIVEVEVQFVGLTNAMGVQGTLRNVGVSRFRDRSGADRRLVYPTDVLPLSQYEARTDALVFRVDQKQLRLFENCGVETGWLLELPLDANDVDLSNLLDVRFVIYWDSFYDPTLEAQVRGALPPDGAASKAWSMSVMAPDELFYLRQNGEGILEMLPADLPYFQTATSRTRVRIRLAGPTAATQNADVTIRAASGPEIEVSSDADGVIDGTQLDELLADAVPDVWTFAIPDGHADIDDIQVFVEYGFTYRTGA